MSEDTENKQLRDINAHAHLPLRRIERSWFKVAVIFLLLLIVGGSIFILPGIIVRITSNNSSTPTGSLLPGENLFYVTTDMPGSHISLDGKILAHLPIPGKDSPLVLSEGQHSFAWQAPPFVSQSCLVSVLPTLSIGPTCATNTTIPVHSGQYAGLSATILAFTASTALLPPGQKTMLFQQIQSYLDTLQATETVQPGEYFVNVEKAGYLDRATQPLRATLTMQLDTNTNSTAECLGAAAFIAQGVIQGCFAGNQNCHTLCSDLFDPVTGQSWYEANSWNVSAVVRITWSYMTSSGAIVAQNQPDLADNTAAEYLFPLAITWDGKTWHITQGIIGPPVCLPAEVWVAEHYISEQSPSGQGGTFLWGFNSLTAATTCQLSGTSAPSGSSATGVFLYRFGVLLAVNSAAHTDWPQLPRANPYEQHLVQA